ncbi:MAG: type I DNA topoisomerase [Aphanocapsa sp. GSE-SYN-MK-11-07L]|jgi:DNA topoisomerase-1|nr:type I DNA topoisomerase [Aphanocapsa sp. GSE-SYN-MK-11-07L]
MANLLIVESPGKIKKLKSILGPTWDVKASVGHIRQLANDGEGSLGFEIERDRIDCRYVARDDRARQTIAGLKSAAKQADEVYIASDPDREGETIGWHIALVLGLKKPKRIIYQEITETAVRAAVASPRSLDMNLVEAGRCRDCLDKLVGYKGSPLVWRLNNGAKSVGRVQSATLHLVCKREREIQVFTPQDYWSVFVDYAEGFRAFYHGSSQTETQAPEEETSDDSGSQEQVTESVRVLSQAQAERWVAIAQTHPHTVKQVEGKQTSKKPPAPFTTSSLQQAAGSRLKFSPEQTMQVAQKLYEAGLITYMRTDSVNLSPDFCAAARNWLQAHDPNNVPAKVSRQRSAKDAQEAHEAIRPSDINTSSAALKPQLSEAEFNLYVLIWLRAIASQCKPALLRKTRIMTESGAVQWQAKGQVVEFAGYGKYWKDLSADVELPRLHQGQSLTLEHAGHEQKQTQPPPRYTEPKLVQLMERRGIGRPSTYAPTIATLKQRQYVELLKGKLQPTPLGLEVDAFLGKALPDLLEAEFTAQMESALDAIADGKQEWQQYLIDWNRDYFEPALRLAVQGLPEQPKATSYSNQLEKSRTRCPSCTNPMSKVPTKKIKKGYFLKCENGCQGTDDKDLVMFWSERVKQWLLPQPKAVQSSEPKLTEYLCPVCRQPLEEYPYRKEGQPKTLLRCSNTKDRGGKKHQDVVYFQSKGGIWWSPKLGDLNVATPNPQ